MKIASVIQPKNGKYRRVTVHGKEYVFLPHQDKNEDTHFVADVKEEKHAETFLANDAFYVFGEDREKKAALKPDAGKKESTQVVHPNEAVAAASKMLTGSAQEISVAVGKSNAQVIAAAIDLENANAKPRANVIGVLQAALDGIQQAGAGK